MENVHHNGFSFPFSCYNIRKSSFHKLEICNFSISLNWISFPYHIEYELFLFTFMLLFLPIICHKMMKGQLLHLYGYDINIYHSLVKFINKLLCSFSHSKLLELPTKLPHCCHREILFNSHSSNQIRT